VQPFHIASHLVAPAHHFLNLHHPLMRPRRAFEIHVGAEPLALARRGNHQRSPTRPQKLRHTHRF